MTSLQNVMITLVLQRGLIFEVNMKAKLFLLVLLLVCLPILSYYFLFYPKTIYCNAKIDSEFVNSSDSYQLDYRIVYKKNKTGYFRITGYVHDEKKSAIYRVMNFKVLEKNNDLLTLKITSIRKSPQDNISDELFNKYFKVVSDDTIMYLNISSLKDGDYLISGTLGPYFICKSE